MRLYKLTDENGQSRGGMQWGVGITNTAKDGEPVLCTKTVLHAYTDPLLAVMLAPIHVDWKNPRLWEAEGDVVVREHDLKVGCKTLTTLAEMPLPVVTTEQRITFAILCALEVYDEPAFSTWAKSWASGEDRSGTAAAAEAGARSAARAEAGALSAASAAEAAARSAAEAAEAGARSAAWAAEAAAAEAGARSAAWAAEAAARSAASAAEAPRPLDLAALARRACA